MSQEKKAVDILVEFCKNPESFCPTANHYQLDENTLLALIFENKLKWILEHFITCKNCSKKASKNFLTNIKRVKINDLVVSASYKKEKESLSSYSAENNIRLCFFKSYSSKNEVEKYQKKRVGSDLDVLVSEKDFPRIVKKYTQSGYSERKYGEKKESQLINPKTKFEIDLHYLLAYPHFGRLDRDDYNFIKKFSKQLLINCKKGGDGYYPDIEYLLITKAVRYFYNDLMVGLGTLHDIVKFYEREREKIDWKKFIRISKRLKIINEIAFIFYLGSEIFDIWLPKEFGGLINMRIRFCRSLITYYDIAIFPPIAKWNDKRFKWTAQKKYLKYRLINSVLRL